MGADQESVLREIESLLVCLIDTSGMESRRMILQRLMELIPMGHHPLLYTENVRDPGVRIILRERYSEILNDIKLRFDLQQLIRNGKKELDLEMGAFLISRFGDDRTVTPEDFRHSLDRLAAPIKKTLKKKREQGPREKLDLFRRYVFAEQGFRGATDNDPRNNFITEVLESHHGIAVSLSVLCLLLARRVHLPLEGVNMPGRFIVRYATDDYLVYMDPFNKGTILTEQECLEFLARQGLKPKPGYLLRASSLGIVKRMYRNLMNCYSIAGDGNMEKKLRQHLSILENASIYY